MLVTCIKLCKGASSPSVSLQFISVKQTPLPLYAPAQLLLVVPLKQSYIRVEDCLSAKAFGFRGKVQA